MVFVYLLLGLVAVVFLVVIFSGSSSGERGRLKSTSRTNLMTENPVGKRINEFEAVIVGLSHSNEDGTDRKEILAECRVNDLLFLVHESTNPEDKNAVAVCTSIGEVIGYISKSRSTNILSILQNEELDCQVRLKTKDSRKEYPRPEIEVVIYKVDT